MKALLSSESPGLQKNKQVRFMKLGPEVLLVELEPQGMRGIPCLRLTFGHPSFGSDQMRMQVAVRSHV